MRLSTPVNDCTHIPAISGNVQTLCDSKSRNVVVSVRYLHINIKSNEFMGWKEII